MHAHKYTAKDKDYMVHYVRCDHLNAYTTHKDPAKWTWCYKIIMRDHLNAYA